MTYEKVKRIINSDLVNYDELQEARTIATECIDKQIPKKPNFIAYDGNAKIGNNHCPNCDCIIFQNLSTINVDYCIRCGQAIDWTEDTE